MVLAREVLMIPRNVTTTGRSHDGSCDRDTVVLTEGEPLTGEGPLRFLLSSILGLKTLDAEAEDLIRILLAEPRYLESQDAVSRALRSILEQRLARGERLDTTAHRLAALDRHDAVTAANRVAFTPRAKPNPRAVFWPDPTNAQYGRSLFTESVIAQYPRFIDRGTPIGSAGSCFAVRIAELLQRDGFNYVVTEPNPDPTTGLPQFCARWGIIFNVPGFRQMVERAFGARVMPRILWAHGEGDARRYLDPFREDVVYASPEEYEEDYERHTTACREALLRCEVFILTLGMNEVWYLKSERVALARAPWGLASSVVEPKVLTVEENLADLQVMLDLWRSHNPAIKIIVSTSPVPLHATFRADRYHVAAANCHSKSTLRLVAEAFAERNRDVYYFPAYETVLYATKCAWEEDQRHVSSEAVMNVMALFREMFLSQHASDTSDAPASKKP